MKRSLFTGFLFLPFGTSVHICANEERERAMSDVERDEAGAPP